MNDEIKLKEFGVTKELFNEWRTPRFGKSNPEKVVSKVWQWLATSRLSGYASNEIMKGGSSFGREATWSFDRFGQTETKLPDGRIIYIGGEHEDYYDPDFYIYNDVAILNTDGSFEFYNYPEFEFLPTDFHSATLVCNKIIIIGSLSYPKVRKSNSTQVYVLDIESFKIISIDTSGVPLVGFMATLRV